MWGWKKSHKIPLIIPHYGTHFRRYKENYSQLLYSENTLINIFSCSLYLSIPFYNTINIKNILPTIPTIIKLYIKQFLIPFWILKVTEQSQYRQAALFIKHILLISIKFKGTKSLFFSLFIQIHFPICKVILLDEVY